MATYVSSAEVKGRETAKIVVILVYTKGSGFGRNHEWMNWDEWTNGWWKLITCLQIRSRSKQCVHLLVSIKADARVQ